MARGDILTYFNQIFVGLCKLFADVDVDVKNGSNLLDRLIKVRISLILCAVQGQRREQASTSILVNDVTHRAPTLWDSKLLYGVVQKVHG